MSERVILLVVWLGKAIRTEIMVNIVIYLTYLFKEISKKTLLGLEQMEYYTLYRKRYAKLVIMNHF